jgi:hypothetical protein
LVGSDELGVLFGVLGDSAFGPDEVDVVEEVEGCEVSGGSHREREDRVMRRRGR